MPLEPFNIDNLSFTDIRTLAGGAKIIMLKNGDSSLELEIKKCRAPFGMIEFPNDSKNYQILCNLVDDDDIKNKLQAIEDKFVEYIDQHKDNLGLKNFPAYELTPILKYIKNKDGEIISEDPCVKFKVFDKTKIMTLEKILDNRIVKVKCTDMDIVSDLMKRHKFCYDLKFSINGWVLNRSRIYGLSLKIIEVRIGDPDNISLSRLIDDKLKKRLEGLESRKTIFSSDKTNCAICLDDYQAGDNLIINDCSAGHTYHEKCLSEWKISGANKKCPMCVS